MSRSRRRSPPHPFAMSMSHVFFVVVGLSSVVLTVLLIVNETSRVHRRQLSSRRPSTSESDTFSTRRLSSGSSFLDKAWAFREPLKRGWKVLEGNVVVHDDDDLGVDAKKTSNPHDFGYTLNPGKSVCADLKTDSISVLVYVESDATANADRRQTIRDTWALPMLQKSMNFRVVFGLGLARRQRGHRRRGGSYGDGDDDNDTDDVVTKEFYAYGDVVQENFTESFKNLGLKSVMGLKWAKDFCPQADFVVKTDDDILVHVPNLMKILPVESQRHADSRLLLCHLNRSKRIVRHGTSLLKYRVSPGELPGAYFPSYCGGFAYAMSRDAVVALYDASLRTPYFFIEDVYVTGFCRHKAGVVATNSEVIALRPHVTAGRAPCDFAEGRVTSQEMDSDQMRQVWRTLNTRGFFCPVLVSVTRSPPSTDDSLDR